MDKIYPGDFIWLFCIASEWGTQLLLPIVHTELFWAASSLHEGADLNWKLKVFTWVRNWSSGKVICLFGQLHRFLFYLAMSSCRQGEGQDCWFYCNC